MISKLNTELIGIFSIFSKNTDLNFLKNDEVVIGNPKGELLKISEDSINSPIKELTMTLSTKLSPLPDQDPDYDLLSQLLRELNSKKAIKELNHIGFCYHVASQPKEKTRLLTELKNSDQKLYEEPSTDQTKWYFLGDAGDFRSPMIEMLPVESDGTTFIDYWLPHIHIDIDTTLTEDQIESLLYSIYDGDPKPFRITVIDNVVYTVRTRLGIVDGVNIFLDLSTNHRNVELSRKNILKLLS